MANRWSLLGPSARPGDRPHSIFSVVVGKWEVEKGVNLCLSQKENQFSLTPATPGATRAVAGVTPSHSDSTTVRIALESQVGVLIGASP